MASLYIIFWLSYYWLPGILLQVQLTYSTNSGQNYSFFVGFPSGCGLDCDDCSVDVSEENVVLVLVKSEESSGATWKGFTVGLNAAQSTVSYLLTHYCPMWVSLLL